MRISLRESKSEVLHGLRTLPTARAIVNLIRKTEAALFSAPVASR